MNSIGQANSITPNQKGTTSRWCPLYQLVLLYYLITNSIPCVDRFQFETLSGNYLIDVIEEFVFILTNWSSVASFLFQFVLANSTV